MDVFEAIKKRESVREYLPKPVEDEKIIKILEAGRLAPSASNRQEWRYVVVRDEETRRKLMRAANNQNFVAEAPVVIACCAETDNHVTLLSDRCSYLHRPYDSRCCFFRFGYLLDRFFL